MDYYSKMDDSAVEAKAAAGDPVAQTRLGVLHARGQGRPKDFAQALHCWQLAAAQGHADAMCNLGNL